MARMSIDDKFLRDPRVTRLAKSCGWSVRETRGCLLDVYAVCYDRIDDVLVDTDIDTAADRDGFGALMEAADLAEPLRGGRKFRIKGARDGVKYLADKQEAGRVGGLKSAESRRGKRSSASKQTKQCFPEIEAPGNPLVPDLVLAPDLVLEEREREPPDVGESPAPAVPPLRLVPDSPGLRPSGKRERRSPELPLPADWVPQFVAPPEGVDADFELAKFRNWAEANDVRKRNWQAQWRNWLAGAQPRRGSTGPPPAAQPFSRAHRNFPT